MRDEWASKLKLFVSTNLSILHEGNYHVIPMMCLVMFGRRTSVGHTTVNNSIIGLSSQNSCP